MRSLHVIILTHLVVRGSAFCYPEEPLIDCARRQEEERSKQPVIPKPAEKDDENNQVNPCLGLSGKEGFIGECKKSSSCAEVSSKSNNCLFSTVCCKKVVTVRNRRIDIPESRPSDINEVFSRQFEDMNRENCGLRSNINSDKNSFLSEKSFFRSRPICSWRGECTWGSLALYGRIHSCKSLILLF